MSTPERVIGTGDVFVGDEPNGHERTMILDRLAAAPSAYQYSEGTG